MSQFVTPQTSANVTAASLHFPRGQSQSYRPDFFTREIVELIADSICALAESPVWHPTQSALYWCDIDGRSILRHKEGEPVDRWATESEPGCLSPATSGGLIVAMRDGVFSFDPLQASAGAKARLLWPAPYDKTRFRFNDGRCDPSGRFLASTLNENKDGPSAELYSMSCEHGRWRGSVLAGGVVTGNGLAFSPDATRLYWADTRAHRIDMFDYDLERGELHNRREFIRFPDKAASTSLSTYGGRPDGAAVDQDGCYWVAMYEGACVLQISPAGEVLQKLNVPVQCPTMVCFGGSDLKTLYVTSARAGRPAAELAVQPFAGSVFMTRVATPGLATNFFQ